MKAFYIISSNRKNTPAVIEMKKVKQKLQCCDERKNVRVLLYCSWKSEITRRKITSDILSWRSIWREQSSTIKY